MNLFDLIARIVTKEELLNLLQELNEENIKLKQAIEWAIHEAKPDQEGDIEYNLSRWKDELSKRSSTNKL